MAAESAGAAPEEPLAVALRDPRDLALAGWPAGRRAAAGRRVAAGPRRPGVPRPGRRRRPGVERRRLRRAASASSPPARRQFADRRRARVAGLLELARQTAVSGTAHEVLWAAWNASGLADAWQAASAAGGSRGAAADADLDAVAALFDAASRFTSRLPPGSPRLFLDSLAGQEIAGDTLAERSPQGDAVAVLTAHRAKGLEWDLVVVAGVQEGTWPDVRMRGSLLGMDELVDAVAGDQERTAAADVAAAALSAKLLAEERRLFYVAATRARRMLVVTAAGGEDSEERPSRFLAELAGDDVEIERAAGAGRGWLSLPALTADLRRAVADPARPPRLRQAAAAQLARLAAAGVRGASPRQWYAMTEPSSSAVLTDGDVRLSPSQVESFTKCGLRWLIESAAGANSPSVLRHLGTVIHAAAVLAADGADDADIAKRIDEIWHHLDWQRLVWLKQRAQAERMVRKFLGWHRANPRELVAVEQALQVRVGRVEITGRVDRLEQGDDGSAIVVDLKTGTSRPPDGDLDGIRSSAFTSWRFAGCLQALGLTEPGGAELVQVGKAGLTSQARVQRQRPLRRTPTPPGQGNWSRP